MTKRLWVPYKKDKAEEIPVPSAFPQEYTPIKNSGSDMATVTIPVNTPRRDEVLPDSSMVRADDPADTRPIFKVQLMASSKPLRMQDGHFKGLSGYDTYQEDNFI